MANNATAYSLPPLPSYTLTPRPQMITGIPDYLVQMACPTIAYWVVSGFFFLLDKFDLCSQYRLHTPAELLKRNHVTMWEVLRDVVLQQIIQTMFGSAICMFDPPEMMGREEYDIALWAQRLRLAQQYVPGTLALLGVNAVQLGHRLQSYPQLASVLQGGIYPFASFASWEMLVAKFIYWIGVPAVQFTVAIIWVDTWQYFLHRAMHMNKFLYTTLHSRHHRLYVPYAFGALYNHPIEGFLLDILGAGVAFLVTGMSIRQGLWFYTCSTIKTVDDHCGYAFPWDPLQHFTSNNAVYHDIHHQSWGVKTNFSQPFFTFWDRFLGTVWAGGDVSARYQRDKILAQKKVDADATSLQSSVTNSPAVDVPRSKRQAAASMRQVLNDTEDGGPRIIEEEKQEEAEAKQTVRRESRRRTNGFDAKSLSERVSGSLHGRSPTILHADGVH